MKAVILAGGGGSRLFPLSRVDFPKQFLKIAGQDSLFTQTVKRVLTVCMPSELVVVTNKEYYFLIKNELELCAAAEAHIICEPVVRNTAPAIALAMKYLEDKLDVQEDEVIFVTPSDHVVRPLNAFKSVIVDAVELAEDGSLVILGVKPDRPETGYGYIQTGQFLGKAYEVLSFKEKLEAALAAEYLQKGNYFWNAGMFAFTMKCMKEAFDKYRQDISLQCTKTYDDLLEKFDDMPNISIDYAVAEKAEKIQVLPLVAVEWSDVGCWDSMADVLEKDAENNSFSGDVYALDCKNTMILSNGKMVACIGLEGLNIVETPDAILISKKGESQKVKHLVDRLKTEGRKEVTENITAYRPWGSYTILSEGPGYKVKKIRIKQGYKLSLQMHYHRSEHWTVIAGTGKFTLDDKVIFFKENESAYIPIAAKHRLENPGKIPLEIIEVQNGKYLGEDDIVRFDDDYGR